MQTRPPSLLFPFPSPGLVRLLSPAALAALLAAAPNASAAERAIHLVSEVDCPSSKDLAEALEAQLGPGRISAGPAGAGELLLEVSQEERGRLRVALAEAGRAAPGLLRVLELGDGECAQAARTVALLADGWMRRMPGRGEVALAPPESPPPRRVRTPPRAQAPAAPSPEARGAPAAREDGPSREAAPAPPAPAAPAIAEGADLEAPAADAGARASPRARAGLGAFAEPGLPAAGWSFLASGELLFGRRIRLGLAVSLDAAVVVRREPGSLAAASRFFGAQAGLSAARWTSGSLDLLLDVGLEWVHASSAGYAHPGSADLLGAGVLLGVEARQRVAGPVEVFAFLGARLRRPEVLEVAGVGSLLTLSRARPLAVAGLALGP